VIRKHNKQHILLLGATPGRKIACPSKVGFPGFDEECFPFTG
jgi:hypothetical protein